MLCLVIPSLRHINHVLSQISLTGKKCEVRFELLFVIPGIGYKLFYKKSEKFVLFVKNVLKMSSFSLHAFKSIWPICKEPASYLLKNSAS